MNTRTLTAAAVERIRAPTSGQIDHFDTGYPGLALRVSYGGAKSWVYFYRLFGKQAVFLLSRQQTYNNLKGLCSSEIVNASQKSV